MFSILFINFSNYLCVFLSNYIINIRGCHTSCYGENYFLFNIFFISLYDSNICFLISVKKIFMKTV